MARKKKTKKVYAVGSSSTSVHADDAPLAKRIEAAMSQAIVDALADGVSAQGDEMKKRQLAARKAVLEAAAKAAIE